MTSPTTFLKHVYHLLTDRLCETDGKRHDIVLRKSSSKLFPGFPLTLFREDLLIYRVLYAVTFGAPYSTCFHKLTLHVLTERSGKKERNRDHIALRKSCLKRFHNFERPL